MGTKVPVNWQSLQCSSNNIVGHCLLHILSLQGVEQSMGNVGLCRLIDAINDSASLPLRTLYAESIQRQIYEIRSEGSERNSSNSSYSSFVDRV